MFIVFWLVRDVGEQRESWNNLPAIFIHSKRENRWESCTWRQARRSFLVLVVIRLFFLATLTLPWQFGPSSHSLYIFFSSPPYFLCCQSCRVLAEKSVYVRVYPSFRAVSLLSAKEYPEGLPVAMDRRANQLCEECFLSFFLSFLFLARYLSLLFFSRAWLLMDLRKGQDSGTPRRKIDQACSSLVCLSFACMDLCTYQQLNRENKLHLIFIVNVSFGHVAKEKLLGL